MASINSSDYASLLKHLPISLLLVDSFILPKSLEEMPKRRFGLKSTVLDLLLQALVGLFPECALIISH